MTEGGIKLKREASWEGDVAWQDWERNKRWYRVNMIEIHYVHVKKSHKEIY